MGPTGVNGLAAGRGRAGLLGAVAWLVRRETDPELKLGAILNTIQGSLLPPLHYLHITHTYRHTHLFPLRVAQWAHLCGLGAVA